MYEKFPVCMYEKAYIGIAYIYMWNCPPRRRSGRDILSDWMAVKISKNNPFHTRIRKNKCVVVGYGPHLRLIQLISSLNRFFFCKEIKIFFWFWASVYCLGGGPRPSSASERKQVHTWLEVWHMCASLVAVDVWSSPLMGADGCSRWVCVEMWMAVG